MGGRRIAETLALALMGNQARAVVPLFSYFDPVNRRIGANLARLRRARRLDRATVADRARLSPARLADYERGSARVTAEHLYRLSGVLAASPERFFESVTSP